MCEYCQQELDGQSAYEISCSGRPRGLRGVVNVEQCLIRTTIFTRTRRINWKEHLSYVEVQCLISTGGRATLNINSPGWSWQQSQQIRVVVCLFYLYGIPPGALESRYWRMNFDFYHQKLTTPTRRGTLVQTLSATAPNENYPTYVTRRFFKSMLRLAQGSHHHSSPI